MTVGKKSIAILELKRLLYDLNEMQGYTCIRFRLMGEMWQQSFLRIVSINDAGVILYNETTVRFLKITNLNRIIQFEIDHNFQNYEAHFHYDVILDDSR